MQFEWDEKKRQTNLRKHLLDFACSAELFSGPMFFREDKTKDYGEARFIGFGQVEKAVVMVSYTNRRENLIRIISMRRATSHEKRLFLRFLNEMEGR